MIVVATVKGPTIFGFDTGNKHQLTGSFRFEQTGWFNPLFLLHATYMI